MKMVISPGNGGVTYLYNETGKLLTSDAEHMKIHEYVLNKLQFSGEIECLRKGCAIQ